MFAEAEGFIKTTAGGTRFSATFVVDGINYTFTGPLGSAMQPWVSNNATLTYSKLKDLTSTREFEGKVGPNKVHFDIANGPKISGGLNMPISPASSVAGTGVWTTNFQIRGD